MINKILTFIICISFLGIIIGIIGSLTENIALSEITNISSTVFVLVSIFLLLWNGDFIKSLEFKLSFLGISPVITGALFKIMHWPYADLILGLGYFSLISFYIIYLFHFKKSHWMYAVKLLFLICFLSAKYLTIIHYPLANEVEIASLSLLIFLLSMYFIEQKKISKKLKNA